MLYKALNDIQPVIITCFAMMLGSKVFVGLKEPSTLPFLPHVYDDSFDYLPMATQFILFTNVLQ